MFSGNFFFSGWQVFPRRSKLCHFIIGLWLDSILLFVAKYIFLSAHFVTPIDLVARVSRYVGVGSWAVRDFSHAPSWVSWALLSIATRALSGACSCMRVVLQGCAGGRVSL